VPGTRTGAHIAPTINRSASAGLAQRISVSSVPGRRLVDTVLEYGRHVSDPSTGQRVDPGCDHGFGAYPQACLLKDLAGRSGFGVLAGLDLPAGKGLSG
jgi:hypothetical protein